MNLLVYFLAFSSLLLNIIFVSTTPSCPDESTISPCSCSTTFKRRSAVNFQNQYHISCKNTTYSALKDIFYNISQTQGKDEIFDHFSASELFPESNGHIEDDFLSGLKIKSVSIVNSNIVSFGPKAFRSVTENLDLSNNLIENLPSQLNLMTRKVNFSHNHLREITSNSFASQTIDLSYNEINLIREKAFKVESALNLNLENNQLESNSIQSGFVNFFNNKDGDTSISLFLNNNSISYLDREVFGSIVDQPSSYIGISNNPVKCDCRVKWLLDAKRYDKSWSTVYPQIEHATCADGADLMKDYYSSEMNNCVNELLREDANILFPCTLTSGRSLRCYRQTYESIRDAVAPVNSLFTQPISLDQLVLERISFPEGPGIKAEIANRLDVGTFEFFKAKEIRAVSSNLRSIDEKAFQASSFYTKNIDLRSNRFNDPSLVFPFVSKFVNLEKVDLSANQITSVPADSFARMARLSSVNLQNNAIKTISRNAFYMPYSSPIYRSLLIDLQSNELSEKSFESDFASVRDTVKVTLNLERNQISQINDKYSNFIVDILARTPSNRNHAILLNENPLRCTNLLREIMRKYLVTFEDCEEYKKVLA